MTGDYRYFRIEEVPPAPKRVTSIYRVISKGNGAELGTLRWYNSWRQFCLFPAANTVWSAGCLADLQDFFKRLAAERARKGIGGT